MSLIEKFENLSDTIEEYRDQKLNERETETFCFEPFIELLGFDLNPVDMRKQYPADLSGKGRTVDYAIKKDGVPIIIVECKPLGDNLDVHTGQLSDYFTAVRKARFGVLTDGCLYQFYTDLDVQNYMDRNPYLEINLLDIQPSLVAELERFTKPRFDLDKALTAARDLKDSKVIRQFLKEHFTSPTKDFVSYVASTVDISIDTPENKQRVTEIVQRELKGFKGKKREFKEEGTDPSPDSESEPATESNENQAWTGKKISGFTFDGKPYKVKKWSEFLVTFCEILSMDDTLQFREVLELKPNIFSESRDSFPSWAKSINEIGKTGIYVHTGINNGDKRDLIQAIVEHFRREMPVPHTDEDG